MTNFSSVERVVEIVDQVPVSQAEQVTVKVLELTQDQVVKEDDPAGVARWSRILSPGAKKTITVRFSVTAPAEAAYQSYMDEMDLMY